MTSLLRRVGRRLGAAVFVLWGAATLTWVALQCVPGDQALAIAGGAGAHPDRQTLETITRQYGLDQPLVVQYARYLGELLRGELGYSTSQKLPVTEVIAENLLPTAALVGSAIVLAWVIGVGWSVLSVKRNRFLSLLGSGLEVTAAAVPQYWLGIILLEVFAFRLGWIPAIGATGFSGLILPALTIAIPLAGFLGQVTREEFESALEQPFVTTARARGMGDWGVRLRHALRHAVLPGLSLTGWAIGAQVSAAVIVETLFARLGLGAVLLQGVTQQDMSLTIGITLIIALVYVLANLLIDALYVVADPRLRTAS